MGCRKTRNMQSKDQNRPGVHLVHPLYGPQTDGTNSQDVPTQWHCPILGKKGDSLQQMAQPKRKGKSATEIHPLIQKNSFWNTWPVPDIVLKLRNKRTLSPVLPVGWPRLSVHFPLSFFSWPICSNWYQFSHLQCLQLESSPTKLTVQSWSSEAITHSSLDLWPITVPTI